MKKRSKQVESTFSSHGSKKRSKQVVKENHPIIQKKMERAWKLSVREWRFAAADSGFGLSFLNPFVIASNATSAQVGIFHAIVSFFPSIFQIITSKLIEKYSRKKIVLSFAFGRSFVYFLLALLSFLFYQGLSLTAWVIIGLTALVYIIDGPAAVAWFSWMGSIVPEKKRGKYFARRNRILGSITLITMILGSFILDFFKGNDALMIGFMSLFILAGTCKFISVLILSGQYEPKLKISKKDEFTFREFLKNLKKTSFGRFTSYASLFRISVWLGSPFFAIYMLRDLGFSYFWYILILTSATLSQLFFYQILGKISDKFGNIRLLRISTFLMAIYPLLWLISSNKFYLIFIPQIISGLGTGGFLLASNNYIYDSLDQKKRSFGLAYFNLFNGTSVAIGSGIGALIALTSFTIFGFNSLFILLISGILRLSFFFLFSGWLKEVRHVEKFKYNWVLHEIRAEGFGRQIHAFDGVRSKVEHVVKASELVALKSVNSGINSVSKIGGGVWGLVGFKKKVNSHNAKFK